MPVQKLCRYTRAKSRSTREARRGPMARGAHVWARPSSLGTGPVPRSHLERRGTVTGLLTAGRVRHIRAPVSWRPASAGHSVQARPRPILMGADRRVFPWGVHRYRGDNVEREVYGGVKLRLVTAHHTPTSRSSRDAAHESH